MNYIQFKKSTNWASSICNSPQQQSTARILVYLWNFCVYDNFLMSNQVLDILKSLLWDCRSSVKLKLFLRLRSVAAWKIWSKMVRRGWKNFKWNEMFAISSMTKNFFHFHHQFCWLLCRVYWVMDSRALCWVWLKNPTWATSENYLYLCDKQTRESAHEKFFPPKLYFFDVDKKKFVMKFHETHHGTPQVCR